MERIKSLFLAYILGCRLETKSGPLEPRALNKPKLAAEPQRLLQATKLLKIQFNSTWLLNGSKLRLLTSLD